jgi:hypothetical protein
MAGRIVQPCPPVAVQGRARTPSTTRSEHGMSDLMRHYLAGQLAHAQALTYFLAPYVNSYKRFVTGLFAPTKAIWSSTTAPPAFASAARHARRARRMPHRRRRPEPLSGLRGAAGRRVWTGSNRSWRWNRNSRATPMPPGRARDPENAGRGGAGAGRHPPCCARLSGIRSLTITCARRNGNLRNRTASSPTGNLPAAMNAPERISPARSRPDEDEMTKTIN